MNQPLSLAAAAAWTAFNDVAERVGVFEDYGDALAAALYAVADQVVPHEEEPREEWLPQEGHRRRQRQRIRAALRAIAAELEGKP